MNSRLSQKIYHIKITHFPVPFKVFNGITLCNIGNYDMTCEGEMCHIKTNNQL